MGFVEQQVRRSNRAMRLGNGALLGLVLLLNLPLYRYWINVVRGPVPMDGAALGALFVAVGAVRLARKARRAAPRDRGGGPSKCRVCGEEVRGAGELCPKCRHETAEALRRAVSERADQERALQEEPRRREDEEEQRRHIPRQEEDACLQQEEEARQREEDARQREREEEDARQRKQATLVAEEVFDPYVVLGVPNDASKEAIHAAYLEAKAKYALDQVEHLGVELQEHYRGKAQAVDRAYQMLTE